MEPNKFEKQVREQLNSREIQPSKMAWDRLDAMLSVAEEKKTKRSFGWLYIAASILVFLSVGMFLLNQKETMPVQVNDVVVNENVDDKSTNDSVAKKQNYSTPISNNEDQVAVTTSNNQPSTIKNQQSSKSFNSINQQKKNQKNQLSIINKEKEIEYLLSEVIAQKDMPKIMHQEKSSVSKSTTIGANELLTSVEESTTTKKSNSIKVNSSSLLSQVDGELELTFREKVFKTVSKNYKEVKVAVTNRNNLE